MSAYRAILILGVASFCAAERVCPYAPPRMFCNDLLTSDCVDDSQCRENAKCCTVPRTCSVKRCTTELLEKVDKTGTCPSNDGQPVICDKFECGEDAHCPGQLKCCSNECGSTECVPPVPAICPNAPMTMACRNGEWISDCSDDSQCAKGEKCCKIPGTCNVRKCNSQLLPGVTRIGSCPLATRQGAICDIFECQEDGHCPAPKKCCTNACGSRECINPRH